MKTRAHLSISGRVQGVCYRMYARDEALRLGLTGWVRNRADGSVEAVAEGEADDVARFVRWCRGGPPMARVTGLQADYKPALEDMATFAVTY